MDMGRTDIEHKMNMNENLNSINLLQKYNKKKHKRLFITRLDYSLFKFRYALQHALKAYR